MATAQRELGGQGEQAAADFLRRAGLQVLALNVCYPCGELDIVARDGGTLVFVEVKTRRDAGQADVPGTVRQAKRRRVIAAARAFLGESAASYDAVRFDVVLVHARPGQDPLFEHHVEAFDPRWDRR